MKNYEIWEAAKEGNLSDCPIKSELLSRMSQIEGCSVKSQLTIHQPGQSSRRKFCILDLVLFRGGEPILIVEVKRTKSPERMRARTERRGKTKQLKRYESFGIPVVLCLSENEIPSVMIEILSFL